MINFLKKDNHKIVNLPLRDQMQDLEDADFIIFKTLEDISSLKNLASLIRKRDPIFIHIGPRDYLPTIKLEKGVELIACRKISANLTYYRALRVEKNYSVSVIIPCKNEEKNIEGCLEEIPDFQAATEVIFCDDQSTDNTKEEILRLRPKYPNQKIILVTGPGQGKAKNVWAGFRRASGDILIIFDGDKAVPGNYLWDCYALLKGGEAELINTTRMTQKVSGKAMPLFNQIGNKFFAMLFTQILGQKVTDSLSGTKALFKKDFELLDPCLGQWGVEDKWGDFELLLACKLLGLRYREIEVSYRPRSYGVSKMTNRIRNGLRMLLILSGHCLKTKMSSFKGTSGIDN